MSRKEFDRSGEEMVGPYLEAEEVEVGSSRYPVEGRRSWSMPKPYDFAIGRASENVKRVNECTKRG